MPRNENGARPGDAPRLSLDDHDKTVHDYTEDSGLIDAADRLLAVALRGGHFRLARRCRECGSWLVSTTSVRRGIGPGCARRLRREAGE